MEPFFRQFFGDDDGAPSGPNGRGERGQMAPRQQREQGEGSGVIVSPEGYILTNNHVVDGATDVRVTLSDKREFKARIVGTDPKTDLAVLKIDASNLPSAVIGDSDKVQVGDYALAIGNPFGVGQTVTSGIVSAVARTADHRRPADPPDRRRRHSRRPFEARWPAHSSTCRCSPRSRSGF